MHRDAVILRRPLNGPKRSALAHARGERRANRTAPTGPCAERSPRLASAHVLSRLWEQIQASQVHILNHTSIAQLAEQSKVPDWTI